jgi:succinate dehydrogenase/fumarate reductase flavoprotein subunit
VTAYDVVVVGFGVAGATAAITAHDAGARVLVVEAAERGGGNAPYSGGFLCDLPSDMAVDHLDALCFGRTPRDVLSAYADGLHTNEGWLHSIGATTAPFEPPPLRFPASFPSWPHLPGGPGIRYYVVAGGEGRRGVALWRALESAVSSRGIDVLVSTRVRELVVDGGTVGGVLLEGGERIEARSVVLACGGFEGDPSMTDAYLPLGGTAPVGHPGNLGDGVRLAHQAGAALWHMYGFFGWFAFDAPGHEAPFAIDFFGPGHLYLDSDGRRFSDETGYEVHDRLRALLTYLPRNPNRPTTTGWALFDESARLAGPLNGMLGTPNDYRWSTDCSGEIEAGWVLAASSPEELAEAMDVDAATLRGTLERYQGFCTTGRDDDFGREADTLVPLDLTRLYAVPVRPGIAGTTGGPRHDARARVLRPDGSAVDGLYAAGAVSLVWGHNIEHGGGLTDALAFGRIAGADATRS